MAYETIKYEVAEQILTITLNRPDKLNAFNAAMQKEMIDAFDQADKDDNIRAIIVTGAGRGFCAGADLSSGADTFDRDARRGPVKRLRRRQGRLQRSQCARRRRPADAAHLQMPEAGDRGGERPGGRHRRHHAARDGYPHRLGKCALRLRVLPARHRAGGRFELVPAAHRRHRAGAGMVLHRPGFPAQEALAGRLVSKVVPADELLPTARALAREIADNTAPVSVALIRQMMWRMLGADDPMEAHKIDSRGIYARGRSDDVKEGVVSFLEKRPPYSRTRCHPTCRIISRGGTSGSISSQFENSPVNVVMPGLVPAMTMLVTTANNSPHYQRNPADRLAVDQQPHRLRAILERQPVRDVRPDPARPPPIR